ncbi:methyltransferase [Candidatus Woesearchaeota archaeon]|nr:methyltransferase [Candidatus Woesearchaeota archaeon]MBW3016595.1 methyltransferase [Candidatus Woesearchaeota archaeon]
MNGLVLTHVGLEDVSASEIKQLISATNVKTAPGKIFFSCRSEQDLVDLCYHGRTFSKVVLLLSTFKLSGVPDESVLKNLDNLIDKTAVVRCERFGSHDFTSFDVMQLLNSKLSEIYNVVVDHKRPQTVFFLLIENSDVFFGVDFSGVDLGRRDYRIFLGTDALKGNIAAALLRIAGYESKNSLLDPFCRHGIIPIEAALFATNTSPHKFCKEKFGFVPKLKYELVDKETDFKGTIIAMDDNFKHVSASRKNAKIAGVVKSVNFSRTDLKWLDAKFGKNFLDFIITLPPQLGRSVSPNKIEKVYHELFYQAEFILKKTGKICLVMKRGVDLVKQKAQEFKFSVVSERKVMQGAEELTIILFSKAC